MRGPDLLDVRLLWCAAIGAGTDSRARRDRAILARSFDLGLRRAELCNLDRTDIEAGPDGRLAAVWIRGKGRTEKESHDPARSNGRRPGRVDRGPRQRIRPALPSPRRSQAGPGRSTLRGIGPPDRRQGWARPRHGPGTSSHGSRHSAEHRPSMLAAISATSGASLATALSRWYLRYDDMRRDVAGEDRPIWPAGATRDAKYKDHAMRGRKPEPPR